MGKLMMICALFAGLEGIALLLPIIQTLLEVEPSQQQRSEYGKVVHAVSETLLAWMAGRDEMQPGKPFCRHFKQQVRLSVPVQGLLASTCACFHWWKDIWCVLKISWHTHLPDTKLPHWGCSSQV